MRDDVDHWFDRAVDDADERAEGARAWLFWLLLSIERDEVPTRFERVAHGGFRRRLAKSPLA